MDGIDVPKVTDWFEANITGASGPLEFRLIAGGRSNLTFEVTDAAGNRYVLRRPPLGHVLATAHDMGREHRIISALAPTAVPVAPALGYCDDPEVNGAPFYVMAFVDGLIVRDPASGQALSPEARRQAGQQPDRRAGRHPRRRPRRRSASATWARTEGYIERQLKRWYGQFNAAARCGDGARRRRDARLPRRPDPRAAGSRPSSTATTASTTACSATTATCVAVLDWEICTLGDPLADLGLLMVYWTDPDDDRRPRRFRRHGRRRLPPQGRARELYAAKSDATI